MLRTELGSQYDIFINKLSSYMVSTGKTYKSHCAVIRRWFSEDRTRASQPSHPPRTQGRDTRSVFEVLRDESRMKPKHP